MQNYMYFPECIHGEKIQVGEDQEEIIQQWLKQ